MRIFFTADLHGSEKCWLKFLAAPKFYQADVIIIGGDITGKLIVPIVHLPKGRVEATFMGRKRKLKKEKDIKELKKLIRYSGQYAVEMTEAEYENYQQHPDLLEDLFRKMLVNRVEDWVQQADDRLPELNVRCLIAAGNDDIEEIDTVLAKSNSIEMHDNQVIDLADGFQIFGLSNSNITPWHCPRDISEEELAKKIEELANQINNMDRAIFNIHVPPYDTGLDEAPELREDMSMVLDVTGQPNMVPVGSTAVRESILKHQPMLGLHGHIHEAAGIRELDKTKIVNPGSEYAEGVLKGALIDLDKNDGITNINLVAG